MNSFAEFSNNPNCFVVQNTTSNPKKTIRIFNAPINYGRTRDLIKLEGVGEDDIRASLLKGELRNRIINEEIIVICSDIDLIQFNLTQKVFLQRAGISKGITTAGAIPFALKQRIFLDGALDSVNRVFTTPSLDKFLVGTYFGNIFNIIVTQNGVEMQQDVDFNISESAGVGTGYDTITFISFVPDPSNFIIASYIVAS